MKSQILILCELGWHDILYGCSDATTEAARFWFMTYTFMTTLIISSLFVGVIIAVYDQVQDISSPWAFSILEPLYRDYGQMVSVSV